MTILPYRKPTEGRDYWLLDDALPDAMAIRERCLAKTDWIEGYPHRPESWPGLRAIPGLEADELASIEAWVRKATGSQKLWIESAPDGASLNHNCVQVVGEDECGLDQVGVRASGTASTGCWSIAATWCTAPPATGAMNSRKNAWPRYFSGWPEAQAQASLISRRRCIR